MHSMTSPPEIDFSLLPNLFIIGAAKAGTTTLHDVLRQHPDIFMTKIKEPSYFSTNSNFQRGLLWYQDTHFSHAKGYKRRGESSVNSLYWSSIAAARIHETYGKREVKFITILRDPVARAYSYYWMHVHSGMETLPFEQALASEKERLTVNWNDLQAAGRGHYGYYRGGCYATLLQPFLDLFPRQRFAFLLLEDLQGDFTGTVKSLAKFLDVEPDFSFQPIRGNPAAEPISVGVNRFLHHPSGALHRLLRVITHHLPYPLRNRLRKGINRANRHTRANPPMAAETENQLRLRYRKEIERLETILERDLSTWKTGQPFGGGTQGSQGV
jgi:Sulfotransferase domain